jgi:hypothetical protein
MFDEMVVGYLEAAAAAAGGRTGLVASAGILGPLEVTTQIFQPLTQGGGAQSKDAEYLKVCGEEGLGSSPCCT